MIKNVVKKIIKKSKKNRSNIQIAHYPRVSIVSEQISEPGPPISIVSENIEMSKKHPKSSIVSENIDQTKEKKKKRAKNS